MGWKVYDEYIDGGYSGGTDDRPAFKRMLYDARQKRFEIIAVCKLDRFFRNLRLLLNYLYEFEQLDINFISIQEGLDTSNPFGKFAVQIMGVIAEFERGRIGERVRDSRHHILARGDWPGGGTLYGYRWHNKDRKWEIVPEEADIVRRVYDLYLKDNLGMIPIAERLNEDGVLTRKGVPWRMNSIRQLLTHAAYHGNHPLGIKVPHIIDQATWQKAQDKREAARSVQKAPKRAGCCRAWYSAECVGMS
jgi:site-specific DNA recombinase